MEYTGYHNKILIICPEHGEFLQTAHLHIKGAKCPLCANKDISEFKLLSQEEFIKRCRETHKDRYDYSKTIYTEMDAKVEIVCPIHGSFWQKAANHALIGLGCPTCNSSKGEIFIQNYLKERGIRYETQYKIEDCKNVNPLPFDIAILKDDNKLVCLIEFNGKQHYEPIEIFGGIDELEKTKFRDSIKKNYCKDKSISLYIIRYDDNIEKAMEDIIRIENLTGEFYESKNDD